jgi:hypothetical protein
MQMFHPEVTDFYATCRLVSGLAVISIKKFWAGKK